MDTKMSTEKIIGAFQKISELAERQQKAQTLADHWDIFSTDLPIDMTPEQIEKLKMAFYAGTAALSRLQFKATELGDQAGPDMLERLHKEISDFAKETTIKMVERVKARYQREGDAGE
jgi:hypothetical protein